MADLGAKRQVTRQRLKGSTSGDKRSTSRNARLNSRSRSFWEALMFGELGMVAITASDVHRTLLIASMSV